MNDKTTNSTEDAEFESFEKLDDGFESDPADAGTVDDAEFQDIAEDLDADVFGEEGEPTPAPKKKVNWFNISVALVAVVVALGLLATKMLPSLTGGTVPVAQTSANSSPALATADTAAQDSAAAATQAVQADPVTPAPAGDLLGNPDQTAALSTAGPAVPALPDTQEADDRFAALDAGTGSAVPMPAPISATQMPDPVAETAAPVVETAPVFPEPVVAEAPVAETPEAPASAAPAQNQVDALTARLDALDAKIEQLEQAPAGGEFTAIQQTLERLEQRMDDLTIAGTVRNVRSESQASAPKKTAKAKARNTWNDAYKAPAKASVIVTPAATKTDGWELRGAQPGKAIIGQSGGDIREIGVGDRVPGLGEITGIATINGQWVVQGTQGRITQ